MFNESYALNNLIEALIDALVGELAGLNDVEGFISVAFMWADTYNAILEG